MIAVLNSAVDAVEAHLTTDPSTSIDVSALATEVRYEHNPGSGST